MPKASNLPGYRFSRDFPLATIFSTARYLRMADGPDEVHMSQLGKLKVGEYAAATNKAR